MPAHDLAQGPQALARYDVLGQHSPSAPRFIQHVALHNADGSDIDHDQVVNVVHMGPPLENGEIRVHAAGSVPLATDEVVRIGVWVEKIKDEYIESKIEANSSSPKKWRQYVIHPPWEDCRDATQTCGAIGDSVVPVLFSMPTDKSKSTCCSSMKRLYRRSPRWMNKCSC